MNSDPLTMVFEYDKNNRLIKKINNGIAVETMTYDGSGNVETKTDGNNNSMKICTEAQLIAVKICIFITSKWSILFPVRRGIPGNGIFGFNTYDLKKVGYIVKFNNK